MVGTRPQKQAGAGWWWAAACRASYSWPGLDDRKLVREGTQSECLRNTSQVLCGDDTSSRALGHAKPALSPPPTPASFTICKGFG